MGANGPGQTGDKRAEGAENEESATVTVLFFAAAREAVGTPRTTLSAAVSTVAQLLDRLRSTYGDQLGAVLPSCAIWVNRSPAGPGGVLRRGDEVALMPPVSGG